ncbi:hypothetical protein SODG_002601 [Sodalis praecaptivus]
MILNVFRPRCQMRLRGNARGAADHRRCRAAKRAQRRGGRDARRQSGDPEPLSHYLLETRQDDLVAGQYRVILGDELAAALGVKRGDAVRLMVPGASQFTPMGRIPSQRLFTVAGTFAANSEVDGYQLLVNQQDASRLMRYPAGYVTGWRLWLQQPLAVESLSAQSLPDGLVWHDWRERKGNYSRPCVWKRT